MRLSGQREDHNDEERQKGEVRAASCDKRGQTQG